MPSLDAAGLHPIYTDDMLYIPSLGHDLSHITAKEATCEEAGNIDYYHCSRCNTNFAYESAEEPMPWSASTMALGHIDEDKNNKCERCGKSLSEETAPTETQKPTEIEKPTETVPPTEKATDKPTEAPTGTAPTEKSAKTLQAGLSTSAIAGIVIAVLAVGGGGVLAVLKYSRKRRK